MQTTRRNTRHSLKASKPTCIVQLPVIEDEGTDVQLIIEDALNHAETAGFDDLIHTCADKAEMSDVHLGEECLAETSNVLQGEPDIIEEINCDAFMNTATGSSGIDDIHLEHSESIEQENFDCLPHLVEDFAEINNIQSSHVGTTIKQTEFQELVQRLQALEKVVAEMRTSRTLPLPAVVRTSRILPLPAVVTNGNNKLLRRGRKKSIPTILKSTIVTKNKLLDWCLKTRSGIKEIADESVKRRYVLNRLRGSMLKSVKGWEGYEGVNADQLINYVYETYIDKDCAEEFYAQLSHCRQQSVESITKFLIRIQKLGSLIKITNKMSETMMDAKLKEQFVLGLFETQVRDVVESHWKNNKEEKLEKLAELALKYQREFKEAPVILECEALKEVEILGEVARRSRRFGMAQRSVPPTQYRSLVTSQKQIMNTLQILTNELLKQGDRSSNFRQNHQNFVHQAPRGGYRQGIQNRCTPYNRPYMMRRCFFCNEVGHLQLTCPYVRCRECGWRVNHKPWCNNRVSRVRFGMYSGMQVQENLAGEIFRPFGMENEDNKKDEKVIPTIDLTSEDKPLTLHKDNLDE